MMAGSESFDSVVDHLRHVAHGNGMVLRIADRLETAHNDEIEKLHVKVRNQRKQLSEVQDALHRRNEGVLKNRWQDELDRLKQENSELRRQIDSMISDSKPMADENMVESGRGGRMSITDELRKWAHGFNDLWKSNEVALLAIADRIDAEHERAMSRAGRLLADAESERDYNYANWQECKQKVLQHNITMNELSAEIERLKDELAHRIEPLKDADDEPINIGDVMDGTCPSGKRVNGTVKAIGDGVFWLSNVQFSLKPDYMHHYHAPTVEDVLLDFGIDWECSADGEDKTAVLKEYVAKLRLAEGEDA